MMAGSARIEIMVGRLDARHAGMHAGKAGQARLGRRAGQAKQAGLEAGL